MTAWREFLVFVDGSEDGLARMAMAMDVAAAHKGRLEALVLVELPLPVSSETLEGMFDDTFRKVRKAGADAVVALQGIAKGAAIEVSVDSWEIPGGQARDAAARAARTADLVIFGKPETLDDSDLDTDIFVGATMEGGRPCLMLPRWIKPHAWGKRGLISWKGTPEAARAVQGAVPFLKEAEAVRLCLASPRSEREGEDEASVARVAKYLERHGVRVETPIIRDSWEGPERMIVSEVEGFNADFMVLGAYEGSRIQEELFGGVTARIVRDSTIPVLMAH
jgi:nucleotide-binding universal stress UspA family protein